MFFTNYFSTLRVNGSVELGENNFDDSSNNNDNSFNDNVVMVYHEYGIKEPSFLSKLKVSALNICGLRSKLKYPDVQDYNNNFGMGGISETKLQSYDEVECYTFYSKPRSKCTQSSGGIGIFVRNNLVNYIKIIHGKSECVLWCKMTDTNDYDCLLLLGTVYIPPDGSKYANDDNFEVICHDLIDLSNNLPIYLMGDYNSRTGTCTFMSDFEKNYDDLFNNLNIDKEIRCILINETNLNDLGITTYIFSQDVKVDNYGHRLIEM